MEDMDSRDESFKDAIDIAALKVVEAWAMGDGIGAKIGGETWRGPMVGFDLMWSI